MSAAGPRKKKPLKQVLPAQHNATKGIQWHTIHTGNAAWKASEVWNTDLQVVLPLRNLLSVESPCSSRLPDVQTSWSTRVTRTLRSERLSSNTVFKRLCFDKHDTRDNTLPRCCVHMKRSAQRQRQGVDFPDEKRRASSKMPAYYLVFIWVWNALVKVKAFYSQTSRSGVTRSVSVRGTPHPTGSGITVSHGLHSHHSRQNFLICTVGYSADTPNAQVSGCIPKRILLIKKSNPLCLLAGN